MVECIFVDISTADGCHVTFTDSSQGINESFNITKPNSTESIIEEYITLSVSGNYTVKAYDIVNDIIIDTPSVVYPNIVQYVSLQLTPPPPPPSNVSNITSISKFLKVIFFKLSFKLGHVMTNVPVVSSGIVPVVSVTAILIPLILTLFLVTLVYSCILRKKLKRVKHNNGMDL